MRAKEPDVSGFVERDGVKTYYEVVGDGEPTVLFIPPWQIVNSRIWKAQVADVARRYRAVVFDARGSGRSDRPVGPECYADIEIVDDAVAVLDAVGADRAVIVGRSLSGWWAPLMAAEYPDRVSGIVVAGPVCPLADFQLDPTAPQETDEGWAKLNHEYWRRDYRGFLDFFFAQVFTEPHSTKQVEDATSWALEVSPETLIDTFPTPSRFWDKAEDVYARVRCPALVIHGEQDGVIPYEHGVKLAAALGTPLLSIEGGGHSLPARDPVRFNLLLRDFIESVAGPPRRRLPSRWTRAMVRPKRALFLSSPIGLGHAQRDVAIADELRRLQPDLEIDWLTQHPVTALLESRGERVHPAARFLANESAHIESEAAEHDLHCFQAFRRMDEILVANFMVFHDVVTDDHYDLVIGDESWDVDHFLHENPELKRAEFAWLTDFVGWLPMEDGGPHETTLAADYNTEMIEHIARFPKLRGRSLFVGNPDDLVPDRLGPGMPTVREWTEANYDFCGYVTGFDPAAFADREALRAELGYRPDERICIVTVGGSGVGVHLLQRVLAAYPLAKERLADLRMVVVTGPRIDPASLTAPAGVDVRAYVPDLYRHLAASDLAVVQGGLTTTMELTATRRPFLYFPLRHHFEQQIHVRHRLERYRAGRAMDYGSAAPEVIAEAMAEEIGREVDYQPVETDGAARAAALLAEMV
jgi:pimeloyl-ACP methyl ester carboxylesterase